MMVALLRLAPRANGAFGYDVGQGRETRCHAALSRINANLALAPPVNAAMPI